MADEDKILLLDLGDKLGYSGESPGTGDVFQYLAQLLANLGLTTDSASSNGDTLQRLAYLVAALGSPVSGTITSALGLVGDAANAAGSANAKIKDVKNYLAGTILNYLNGTSPIPGLGSTGDAANVAGSANAKLAYLIAAVAKLLAMDSGQYGPLQTVSEPAPSSSWATLANISSPGEFEQLYLLFMASGGASGGSGHIECRVTVDGGTPRTYVGDTLTLGANSASSIKWVFIFVGYSGGNWWYAASDPPFKFGQSLLVEYRTIIDSGTFSFSLASGVDALAYKLPF